MPKGSGKDGVTGSGDDPLGINRLSMDYDYLLYKIGDYVQSIQIQTDELCKEQNTVIKKSIIEDVVDKNISEFKNLLEKCNELENYFDMLEQILMISETFKERLKSITSELNSVKISSTKK